MKVFFDESTVTEFGKELKKLCKKYRHLRVQRLYVSIENDHLPAIAAQYRVGGRILYVRDILGEERGRFGMPRRNDLIFVYELAE